MDDFCEKEKRKFDEVDFEDGPDSRCSPRTALVEKDIEIEREVHSFMDEEPSASSRHDDKRLNATRHGNDNDNEDDDNAVMDANAQQHDMAISEESAEHAEKRKFMEVKSEEDVRGEQEVEEGSPEEGRAKKKATQITSPGSSSQKEVYITATMDCPSNIAELLVDKRGSKVNEIMSLSSCRINVAQQSFDGGSTRQVTIIGSADGLSAAMSLITQAINEAKGRDSHLRSEDPTANDSTQEEERSQPSAIGEDMMNDEEEDVVICPHSRVGILIGLKGGTVAEIYKRTECKVQVIQEGLPDGADRIVSFQGSKEQVKAAKALVREVIDKGVPWTQTQIQMQTPTGNVGQSNVVKDEMEIQPSKVGGVIGSKGIIIKELMRRSGCKITVNQDFPTGEMHKVLFTGMRSQIDLAKSLVEETLKNGSNNFLKASVLVTAGANGTPGESGKIAQEVNIFSYQLARFTENGQFMRRSIERRFNVQIEVDSQQMTLSDGQSVHKVVIIGAAVDVDEAMSFMLDALNPNSAPVYAIPGQEGIAYMPSMQPIPLMQPAPYMHSGGNGYMTMPSQIMHAPQAMQTGAYMPYAVPAAAMGSMPPSMQGNMGGMAPVMTVPQTAPSAGSTGLYLLGADGTAGRLEAPTVLSDGMHMQVAEIRNDHAGKVTGKNNTALTLMRNKSGACLQMNKAEVTAAGSSDYSKLVLVGLPQCVQLASRMLQEVLVNGVSKLNSFPDMPPSVPSNYATNYATSVSGRSPKTTVFRGNSPRAKVPTNAFGNASNAQKAFFPASASSSPQGMRPKNPASTQSPQGYPGYQQQHPSHHPSHHAAHHTSHHPSHHPSHHQSQGHAQGHAQRPEEYGSYQQVQQVQLQLQLPQPMYASYMPAGPVDTQQYPYHQSEAAFHTHTHPHPHPHPHTHSHPHSQSHPHTHSHPQNPAQGQVPYYY